MLLGTQDKKRWLVSHGLLSKKTCSVFYHNICKGDSNLWQDGFSRNRPLSFRSELFAPYFLLSSKIFLVLFVIILVFLLIFLTTSNASVANAGLLICVTNLSAHTTNGFHSIPTTHNVGCRRAFIHLPESDHGVLIKINHESNAINQFHLLTVSLVIFAPEFSRTCNNNSSHYPPESQIRNSNGSRNPRAKHHRRPRSNGTRR